MFIVRRYGPIIAQRALESRFTHRLFYNTHMWMLRQSQKFESAINKSKDKLQQEAAASSTQQHESTGETQNLTSSPLVKRCVQWWQTQRYEWMVRQREKAERRQRKK